MAYNFNQNQFAQNQPTATSQQYNPQLQTSFQQNIQPLFPQPQGNVYNINSTLEVANVPVGAGMSVALCLPEGFMYIKTMQNGNPMFWAYRITPYDNNNPTQENEKENKKTNDNNIMAQLEQYDKRFADLEKQVNNIQNTLKSDKGEWNV